MLFLDVFHTATRYSTGQRLNATTNSVFEDEREREPLGYSAV